MFRVLQASVAPGGGRERKRWGGKGIDGGGGREGGGGGGEGLAQRDRQEDKSEQIFLFHRQYISLLVECQEFLSS